MSAASPRRKNRLKSSPKLTCSRRLRRNERSAALSPKGKADASDASDALSMSPACCVTRPRVSHNHSLSWFSRRAGGWLARRRRGGLRRWRTLQFFRHYLRIFLDQRIWIIRQRSDDLLAALARNLPGSAQSQRSRHPPLIARQTLERIDLLLIRLKRAPDERGPSANRGRGVMRRTFDRILQSLDRRAGVVVLLHLRNHLRQRGQLRERSHLRIRWRI